MKYVKKLIWLIICISELVIVTIISKITGISTENTWLGLIGGFSVIITLLFFAWKKVIKYNEENHSIYRALKLVLIFVSILACVIIIGNIVYFGVNGF